jgi:hypothetical protein
MHLNRPQVRRSVQRKRTQIQLLANISGEEWRLPRVGAINTRDRVIKAHALMEALYHELAGGAGEDSRGAIVLEVAMGFVDAEIERTDSVRQVAA